MRKIALVLTTSLAIAASIQSAQANSCANTIINATKRNLGSEAAFRTHVCIPYLSHLAKKPVLRTWEKMSMVEQTEQLRYACKIFYSVAGRLARFNPQAIKWNGNIGLYGKTQIKVAFKRGCLVTTACIKGSPCLESIVTDYRTLSQ